jgi:hypothetical protein
LKDSKWEKQFGCVLHGSMFLWITINHLRLFAQRILKQRFSEVPLRPSEPSLDAGSA